MKITVNDIDFRIHFMYGRYDGRRQTRCEIHIGPCIDTAYKGSEICGAPHATGFSWCSRLDEFTKAKGRKIALARAMQKMDRDLRRGIWHAYLAVVKERVRV